MLSLIITALIVTILLYPIPVTAVQVSITQLSGQRITQGQTHTFYINIQIDTGEMIPINKVRITVTGPTSFTYEFPAASGGTDTYITLLAPMLANYDYGAYYGYGYGYFPGYGYGYGYYPYGYGYGFSGPQTITWQATLKNTASLPTGTYKMTAEVESDGVWWGGSPTEVTFTIVAAPLPPPPPTAAPDLTTQFVDLPTEFQATRTYDIKMQIKNIGTANAGAFNVTLTANGTLINSKVNVPSLAAGEQTNITIEWTPATIGNYNFVATADSDGDIAESNEANNAATTTVTVGVFVPTPAEVEVMTDAEAAQALSRLSIEQAAAILEQVSVTKCARVLLAMDAEFAARVLLAMDPDAAASIVEEMVDINASGAAAIIEEATAIDIDGTVAILELMDTEHLARLIIAIINLPSTPQVAAQLLEAMNLEKAVDVVKVIVELGAQEDLAKAFPHLTTERLTAVMEALTVEERGSFLPYMTSEDIERIEALIEYPDLTVTSITVTPEQLHAEEASTVTVTVKNIGRADVNVFTVRLSVNGVTLQTLTVEGLTVDQTRTVTFSWIPTAQGTYTLKAVVDPEGAVEELVETNNELSTAVTVLPKLLPDLTVAFTSLPQQFTAGTQYTITVTISNIGTASAGEFAVELRANNALVGTQTVSSLAAGASTTVTFSWTPASVGQYTLVATVDPENVVVELNENNNSATQTVTVVEAFPWMYVVIAAVIIIVIIVVAYVLLRRKK
ncbi:hypothetical protein KEJ15_08210 [Candidatus Bathyarchaeota archaeon]|nr:hypothetical protein [Candidatus Bathyarchaeota archaeon]